MFTGFSPSVSWLPASEPGGAGGGGGGGGVGGGGRGRGVGMMVEPGRAVSVCEL